MKVVMAKLTATRFGRAMVLEALFGLGLEEWPIVVELGSTSRFDVGFLYQVRGHGQPQIRMA